MTSLLLLRRSLTRSLWHEFNGMYLLFPSVLHSLVLRSLLDRRWRRWRPDPAFLRPSQGSRTAPGLSSPRPLTSGSACPFLHPVTCLLHRLGCGPDGAPSLTRPWSVVLRLLRYWPALLDLVDLQTFSQDLPQWDLTLFLHLQRLLLIPKRPLLPPCAFEDFFRVPRPLLSLLRHRPAWTLSLLRWRSKTLGPSPRDQPRRWSKGGRRNSWWTWEPVGSSS